MSVSAYVISAICGCFKRESGVNPAIWESLIVPSDTFSHVHSRTPEGYGVGGYGFGQLTNTQEQNGVAWRLRDYYDWCVANNHSVTDGNEQMNYIVNVEQVWMNSSSKRGSYTTIQEFLASTSTNLEDLTWDWLACWEGVPGDAFSERYQFALQAYQYIYQHQNDDPNDYSWIQGNFYMSTEQTLNNVMCMYFYFDGYTPDPGPGPSPSGSSRKMPFWMYLKSPYRRV